MAGADRPHLGAGPLHVEAIERADRLDTEDDVLRDREHRHQHEVLVDHADAGVDGVLGVAEIRGLAVDEDLALIRAVEPRENVHQRGFAGAVLAEQAQNFARADFQVHVGVRYHRAEALGDAA